MMPRQGVSALKDLTWILARSVAVIRGGAA